MSSVVRTGVRPVSIVPPVTWTILLVAGLIQVGWALSEPKPVASAEALRRPPEVGWLRAASLGEPIGTSQALTLYLQAFDNQPGISVPFLDLDYSVVEAWLTAVLALDPATDYPLMMAAQLYAQVPDQAKQRRMLDFVHREFLGDPDKRWRWLAHAAIVAKHRLHDMPLALAYADDIARYAPHAPGWARQMRIFILEEMGEIQAASVLLGGLLATGEVTDKSEIHFLMERLAALKSAAEKSSKPSEFR